MGFPGRDRFPGLIVRQSTEAIVLKRLRGGTFILDESHKARRRGQLGVDDLELNSLIVFMIRMANNARHVLLCTATPIHTAVRERWDLLMILNQNADFVMKRDHASSWRFWQLVPSFRSDLNMADKQFHLSDAPTALTPFARSDLQSAIKTNFFQRSNPFVRHDGLRRRKTLEDAGLLEKIAVDIHPDPEALSGTYPGVTFVGRGLMTNRPFELAYEAAEAFIDVLSKRTKSAKLLRSVFLQRIFSSFQSGRLTLERMLERRVDTTEDNPQIEMAELGALRTLTDEEMGYLEAIRDELARPEPLVPETNTIAILVQDLQPIPIPVHKHKQRGRKRVEPQALLHHRTQTRYRLTKVHRRSANVDRIDPIAPVHQSTPRAACASDTSHDTGGKPPNSNRSAPHRTTHPLATSAGVIATMDDAVFTCTATKGLSSIHP
jgi:hypothetical protein